MFISEYLKLGRLEINPNKKCLEIVGNTLTVPYEKITPSDWGLVFEKFVGQVLEDEGYEVIFNGLNKGLLDMGIDLIAKKEDNTIFIQCKYGKKKISKNMMEWILYNASYMLDKEYKVSSKKISFMLVVNCKELQFSKKMPKGFNPNFFSSTKIEYPILHYFLHHNNTQNKVKVEFREILMKI